MNRWISLQNGTKVPKLGQGTWHMGDSLSQEKEEIATLRRGVELGMNLIDTAEMYGDGNAERLVGKAMEGIPREDLCLVSKVIPSHAGKGSLEKSLDQSLKNMKTDYLDLYLLHWVGSIPLKETVGCMEAMVMKGKIRGWGVSNFDTKDMRNLFKEKLGNHCQVNQVLYHLGAQGVEFNLLPSLADSSIPVMAYCPLAQGGTLGKELLTHSTVVTLAHKYQVSPMTILLAYPIQHDWVFAIPKSSTVAHVEENVKALQISFDQDDLDLLENTFPKPTRKSPLEML